MVCLYLTYGIRSDPHSSSKNSPCTLIHHWSPKVTRPTPASTLNFQTRVHCKTRVLKNINNSRETLKLETRLDLNRRTSLNKKTHTHSSRVCFFWVSVKTRQRITTTASSSCVCRRKLGAPWPKGLRLCAICYYVHSSTSMQFEGELSPLAWPSWRNKAAFEYSLM